MTLGRDPGSEPELGPAEVVERYPKGAIDHDNLAQWLGFLARQLLVNRCDDCGQWSNPPRAICPACWSPRVRPQPVRGRGRVQWFTLLFQGAPAESAVQPYPVVVVELEEQPNLRVTSTIVGCDPDAITCDMAVELIWDDRAGAPLPVFRPRPGGPPGEDLRPSIPSIEG
jgi:uncharacterized protein